jgi:DNA-binding MarR family transcriptional regulator
MEPRWLSPDEQATWRAYLLATMLIEADLDRQMLADNTIPVAHYAVLVALSESSMRRMRMRELADELCSSPSRMTHAVASLERRGWVRRETCDTDARGQYAVLTDAGHAALVAAAPGHVEAVRRNIFDRLDDDQRAQLRSICETLLAGFDRDNAWSWAKPDATPAR